MLRDESCIRRPVGLTGFKYINVWQVKSYHSYHIHAQRYRPVLPGTSPDGVCLSKEWVLGWQPHDSIFLLQDVQTLLAILDGRRSDMGHAIRLSDGAAVELRSAVFTSDWRLMLRGWANGVVRVHSESELYVPTLESQRRILEEGGGALFD